MLWYTEIIVEEIFTEHKLAIMPFAEKQRACRWTFGSGMVVPTRVKNHFDFG
jgi:hypothetical protein